MMSSAALQKDHIQLSLMMNMFTYGDESNEIVLNKVFDGLNAYVSQFHEMLDLNSEEPSEARERAYDKMIENLFIQTAEAYTCRLMLMVISQSSFKTKLTEMPNANQFWHLIPKLW